MPANLPPHYFEAERRYREAGTPQGKIEALDEMLMIMPKHKGTDKLRADLRRKISKLKAQAKKKKGGSRRETVYSIDREGAAQVLLVGPPNSGKSSLVDKLTNARPEVADFPHTTWKPTPGMVPFENIQFQPMKNMGRNRF
jgi:ribosome-interacting GTPase 1